MLRKSIVALAAVAALAVAARAQTVDEIVAKHVEARGGMAKIKAVKTMRSTGKRDLAPGLSAPIVVEQSRPNKMRADFTVQGLTGTLAYDGASGWQIMPFQGNKDPEPMAEEMVKEFAEDSDIDGPLVDWKEKGHKIELVGKEQVEGTDAYKLKLTRKGGTVSHVWIDADSFLEIKGETKRMVRGTEQETVYVVGDYKEVAGMMMPHSVQFSEKGGPVMSMTFDKIEVNPAVEDARFKMPAAPKKADANAPAAKPENKEAETKPAEKKPAPVKPPTR
jgi:outer membrane lipoprotein-sorting protein